MKVAMMSRVGGRENNEDCIGKKWSDKYACFVAADGMGGHKGGEVASRIAVDSILECFKAQPEISADIMYAYIEAAQNAILDERRSNAENSDMGTTVVALVTDGENAVWGHCGDSRLYRFEKNLIQEVTEDHSVAFMSFMAGEIKYKDIRYSPDQNRLLRSLSGGESFKPEICGPRRLPDKSAFLLCTDGFWEHVTENDMEKALKKAQTPRRWLEQMLKVWTRNAPRDADNYSAIAIFI